MEGSITPTPPEAAVADAISVEMEGRRPEVKMAATAFLGLRKGIPITLEALGGLGKTTLCINGWRDLPKGPKACLK